ncbi:MAG TPA: hypothetical protein VNO43_09530 [Candidatus Eisenbacteria bacterium]|nr:hypothetical protein [Candidatus Eisenbacteria bacterium]
MKKPVIGVMGASVQDALAESERLRLQRAAEALGEALAQRGCVLLTGATTGLPDLVSNAFRKRGGLAIGVSPASDEREHVERFGLPCAGCDVIVYTGFGLKGRNVVGVRSADVVIIFGGATGTLNEFTIAYDEGKIIGVLEGSGGVADHIREIIDFCKKPALAAVVFERDAAALVEKCLRVLTERASRAGG